jgi:hypothetical protein
MTLDELKQIDRTIMYVVQTAKTDGHYNSARASQKIIEREIKLKLMEKGSLTGEIVIERHPGGLIKNA